MVGAQRVQCRSQSWGDSEGSFRTGVNLNSIFPHKVFTEGLDYKLHQEVVEMVRVCVCTCVYRYRNRCTNCISCFPACSVSTALHWYQALILAHKPSCLGFCRALWTELVAVVGHSKIFQQLELINDWRGGLLTVNGGGLFILNFVRYFFFPQVPRKRR